MKAQNTNLRNIYGKGIKYDVNGKIDMDSTNVMTVPKGTTSEYLGTPQNGDIRYNTDTNRYQMDRIYFSHLRLSKRKHLTPQLHLY